MKLYVKNTKMVLLKMSIFQGKIYKPAMLMVKETV